jgi:hypothetical protein
LITGYVGPTLTRSLQTITVGMTQTATTGEIPGTGPTDSHVTTNHSTGGNAMDPIQQARYRIRDRQWEAERQQRRLREYERAIEKLEREEHIASFPNNENRHRDIERIRAEKREVLAMMDEEFKLSEQYQQIADGL